MDKPIIILTTGWFGSGKDAMAEYLRDQYGFQLLVCSDVLRRELARRGIAPTRDALFNVASELRTKYGPGVLAERLIPEIANNRVVVAGVRALAEQAAFGKVGRSIMVEVRSDEMTRLQRLQDRQRAGESKLTIEDLRAKEAAENTNDQHGVPLGETLKHVSEHIDNNGTMAEFHAHIDSWLKQNNLL